MAGAHPDRQRLRLLGRQRRRPGRPGRSTAGLDYLTLEYLAELTMSILALQQQRDPQAGYASDFLDVLRTPRPASCTPSRR